MHTIGTVKSGRNLFALTICILSRLAMPYKSLESILLFDYISIPFLWATIYKTLVSPILFDRIL